MIELTATIESVRLSPDEKENQAKCQVSFRFKTDAFNTLTLNVNTEMAKQYAKMLSEGSTLVFKMGG